VTRVPPPQNARHGRTTTPRRNHERFRRVQGGQRFGRVQGCGVSVERFGCVPGFALSCKTPGTLRCRSTLRGERLTFRLSSWFCTLVQNSGNCSGRAKGVEGQAKASSCCWRGLCVVRWCVRRGWWCCVLSVFLH